MVLSDASVDEGAGPLRATGIEGLFTPDGPAAVEPVDAGLLRITSGQLAVSDPSWIGENLRTVAVPPGEFPVALSLLRTTSGVHVAAARVTFLDVPPREWEMTLRPDEDLFEPLDSRFTVELPGPEPEPNLIAFRAGQGDGSHPVWTGRTDDGQVACVVVGFQLRSAAGQP